ncbi:leucyl aminopeptidase [Planomonospora parontospora]|uniref:leucyl aminopeptidase n=1 Tax=Planomonospora parontospora TaxID=58119 RepID=UPI00167159A8|nr:leucyl aminopeptidase [Planomonospora parontospora]GGL04114.1 putative cytosol aminopeptidase [Planomonospora parontospora subsp. antibiotica]GII13440.1 putative cytosol aminopeptidase [Planomonospora parontospora subsp. antibiotica]
MRTAPAGLASAYVTTVRLNSSDNVVSFDTEALVVGVHTGPDGLRAAPGAEGLDEAFGGRLAATLGAMGVKGKPGEIAKVPTFGALTAPLLVAVGLGDAPEGDYDPEVLRRAAGTATRALAGTGRVALALPAADAERTAALALGGLLGAYSFTRYRTGGEQTAPVGEITVLSRAEGAEAAVGRAATVAASVSLVRDLVNTPPSDLWPARFAEIAEQTGAEAGLSVEVLDEKALKEGGYGGIVAVGQGSVNPPRLVRLAYSHPEAAKTVAFVGKGITFDSGGLSLKPTASMDWMKSDMGGAGAVFGALVAIARLGLKVNAVGYLCLAENMPSGTAQRPSDVFTSYAGKTVEVLDTDAEGRLVLIDGIARAGEDSPDLIVDVATLTGAQIVALGWRTAGVMANDDELREEVVRIAAEQGESTWGMPLPDELRKGLDSPVADIANLHPERFGGMLTAAIFLREFVPEGVRWAHIDMAGPAFNKGEPHGYTPKGGTGAITRTLVGLAEQYSR